MKKKAFFIIFKGLSMKQITQIFLEGESPTLKRLARRRKITKIQLSQEPNV